MSELSRQGMVKANLAAIEYSHSGSTWCLAEMVRVGVEAYVAETTKPVEQPRPWDDCSDPRPRTEEPGGYCQTCGGLMIVNDEGNAWVHPPKGWQQ